MLRRIVALGLALTCLFVVAHQAWCVADGEVTTAYLSDSDSSEELWVKPATGSRELVRPPERNVLHSVAPAFAFLGGVVSLYRVAPLHSAGAERRIRPFSARRLLRHRGSSSLQDDPSA